MKGYRTYTVAALIALVTAVLPALSGLDWVAVMRSMGIPEAWAIPIGGLVGAGLMAAMRSVTTTSPGVMPSAPPPAKRPGVLSLFALLPAGAVAATLFLGGCVSVSPATSGSALQLAVAVGRIVSPSSVARLDRTIAEVAGSRSVTAACSVFTTAAGYYGDLRSAIPERYARIGDPAVAAGRDLCAAPPADTAQALAALNRLWAGVQDSTKTR